MLSPLFEVVLILTFNNDSLMCFMACQTIKLKYDQNLLISNFTTYYRVTQAFPLSFPLLLNVLWSCKVTCSKDVRKTMRELGDWNSIMVAQLPHRETYFLLESQYSLLTNFYYYQLPYVCYSMLDCNLPKYDQTLLLSIAM